MRPTIDGESRMLLDNKRNYLLAKFYFILKSNKKIIFGIIDVLIKLWNIPRSIARETEKFSLRQFRRWQSRNPSQLLQGVRLGRRLGLRTAFLARAEAVLTARTAGWDAATPHFADVAVTADGQPPLSPLAMTTLLESESPPSAPRHLAVPAPQRPIDMAPEISRRIVIYTVGFGERFSPTPLFGVPPGVRCLCFTDRPLDGVPGWEVVPVAADGVTQAFYKLCPHRILPAVAPMAEMSLYVAADRVIAGNLHTLLNRWFVPQAFALWRHAEAGDWHDLAERHLLRAPACTTEVLGQARAAARDEVPRGRGAYDTGVLWRHHDAPAVVDLMERWWVLQQVAPGPDDVNLYRSIHDNPGTAPLPAIMPEALGAAPSNVFFIQEPPPLTRNRRQRQPDAPVKITFLYAEERADSLHTILRGQQLSEIAAAGLGPDYEVSYVSDRYIDSIHNQIVILNLLVIAKISLEKLSKLKKNNTALISDWQDSAADTNKVMLCDAQMTLSIPQTCAFNRLFPDTPAFHVTHNVNKNIKYFKPPMESIRTLYFGAPTNTSIPDSLKDVVDLIEGKKKNLPLEEFIPQYNCHWIVRANVPIEQFWLVRGASPLKRASLALEQWKPFLKGFVAARCGAVVLVTRDDANAPHYLGDDYPFYANSLAPADLETAWLNAATAFGGPEWRHAQAIMRQVEARSSDAQVCAEFKAMVDAVIA